jgi:hypothetical protein
MVSATTKTFSEDEIFPDPQLLNKTVNAENIDGNIVVIFLHFRIAQFKTKGKSGHSLFFYAFGS